LRRIARTRLADLGDELITLRAVLPCPDKVSVALFRPDGGAFLVGGGRHTRRGKVSLCETSTGKPLANFEAEGEVTRAAFSPDGRLLALSGETLAVRSATQFFAQMYEVAGGKKVGPLLPHPFLISSLAFSPDGRTLLVAWSSLERGEVR